MATETTLSGYNTLLTGVHPEEQIVQQLVGQLLWGHYVLPLSNIKDASLNYMHKPQEIAKYKLAQSLPDDIKGSLPTIEELEKELGELNAEVSRDE